MPDKVFMPKGTNFVGQVARSLILPIGSIVIMLSGLACAESGAPVAPDNSLVTADSPAGTLSQTANAPPLESNSATFAMVQGRGETFKISYVKGLGSSGPSWFLRIRFPADAQFVDASGAPLAAGDSIEITLDVDPAQFYATFGPHGTRFPGGQPATLTFNYTYADLGGREPADLKIWYQPLPGDPWTPEPTVADVRNNTVTIELDHFSNYAVAW